MQTDKIKIVVVGSVKVGKTSLLNALVNSRSPQIDSDDYKPFDNVSTMTVQVIESGVNYRIELWDTKSVDFYKIIDGMHNDNEFNVVLICYSVMELKTYQDVKKKVNYSKSIINSCVC